MRYPADKQYLAFPRNKDGRGKLNTFARRRAGVGSCEMIEKASLWVITCVLKDRKRRIKINSEDPKYITDYLDT